MPAAVVVAGYLAEAIAGCVAAPSAAAVASRLLLQPLRVKLDLGQVCTCALTCAN